MKKFLKHAFLSCSILSTQLTIAQNGVTLGEPSFMGNGCNRGTASASITEDGQTLSILFDDYIAEAGGNLRRQQDRKHCNIGIPVMVPPGHSVAVFSIDYRGFHSLPEGAESKFAVDYFFGPRSGPRIVKKFQGPLSADFITNNNITSQEMTWSPCGRSFLLRAVSSMNVTSNRLREQSIGSVDSADMQAGLVYHLQWRRCTR